MNKKTAGILFLAILFLAIGLRLIGLDRSFILDEFRTIKFASSKESGISNAIRIDSYPPLSYLMLSAWMDISRNDIWIRLLFAAFGALSVVMVYLIGKELISADYALLAMFLMALMPMQVWVSQYARGISPAIFFILVSTLFFIRLIKHKEIKAHGLSAIGYLAGAALAVYSFYFSFFVIAGQNIIYLALNRNNIRNILKWCLLQAALIVLFLPWLGGFLRQMQEANITMNFSIVYKAGFNLGGLPVGLYMRGVTGFLGLDQAFLMNVPVTRIMPMIAMPTIAFIFLIAAISYVYIFAMFCGQLLRERRLRKSGFSDAGITVFFSLFAGLPFLSAILLNIFLKTPITPRYFAVSSAFLIFIYALILSYVKNKKLLYFIIAVFTIVSLARLSDFTKGVIDYKQSARFIGNNIRTDECLLFVGGDTAYSYYASLPKNYIESHAYMEGYEAGSDYSLERLVDKNALERRLGPFKTVWVYHSGEKMSGMVQYVLGLLKDAGYKKTDVYTFRNIEIFKYAKG